MTRRRPLLARLVPLLLPIAPLLLGGCAKHSSRSVSPSAYGEAEGGGAMAEGAPAGEAMDADAAADAEVDAIAAERRSPARLAAARLTAGVFDDALNPGLLGDFAGRLQGHPGIADLALALAAPVTIVTVVDAADRPIVGARV